MEFDYRRLLHLGYNLRSESITSAALLDYTFHQTSKKVTSHIALHLCFFVTHASLYSAIWINLVGLVALISLCCYGGMVIFARFKDCDPLTAKVSGEWSKLKGIHQILSMFSYSTSRNQISFSHSSSWIHLARLLVYLACLLLEYSVEH